MGSIPVFSFGCEANVDVVDDRFVRAENFADDQVVGGQGVIQEIFRHIRLS